MLWKDSIEVNVPARSVISPPMNVCIKAIKPCKAFYHHRLKLCDLGSPADDLCVKEKRYMFARWKFRLLGRWEISLS